MAFYSPHIWLLAILLIHGKYIYTHVPYFQTLQSCIVATKLLLKSKSWGCVRKSPTVQKSYPLPYPIWQLYQIKARVGLDQVVLQHTHNEWSSVTGHGLLIIGLSSFDMLAGGCAGRTATL